MSGDNGTHDDSSSSSDDGPPPLTLRQFEYESDSNGEADDEEPPAFLPQTMTETTTAPADSLAVNHRSQEPIQLRIDWRDMGPDEIRRSIESLMDDDDANQSPYINNSVTNQRGNTLSLSCFVLNTAVTEDLIRFIRQKKEWESISLLNFMGDPNLSNDLLLACTTHPSIRSIAWSARLSEGIHAVQGRTVEPTNLSTINALLYGIKYNSHLTRLDVTGLVLDVDRANLLSRALVRNTTIKDLRLNGTRFLTQNRSNGRANDQDHLGTKNMTVQTLSFGLRFNRTIESLSFEMCNNLEDEDIACLVNAVNQDGTVLRRLSLQETACFDQGMSSIAVLLQENVIEDLNLSYLVRRRRKPPEQKVENQEDDEEDEEESKSNEEAKVEAESESSDSDQNEKDESDAKPDPETNATNHDESKEQQKQEEKVPDKSTANEASNKPTDEEERQKVRNTSLRVLAMAGNNLDDEYLESLLGIFPSLPNQSIASQEETRCSNLEELNLLGNRFSNHGIKDLLKRLPQFPNLQRLYLGYQRAPPPWGPSTLPPGMLSRMMTMNPTLAERNAQFSPESLRNEFRAAVAENPINFRLAAVNIMALTEGDRITDRMLKYHMRLNIGGRKILASYAKSNASLAGGAKITGAKPSSVPLGLWPMVLGRANRLYPVVDKESQEEYSDNFHSGDVIFCLLHGPMVFENLVR